MEAADKELKKYLSDSNEQSRQTLDIETTEEGKPCIEFVSVVVRPNIQASFY